MSVVVLRSLSEVASSQDLLDELVAHASEPNIFFESWFLRAALSHLRQSDQEILVTLVCAPEGTPLALIPLHVASRSLRSPFRRTSVWQHRHCFLGTPLLRATREVEAFTLFLAWLRSYTPRASLFTLPCMSADGPVYQAIVAALRNERLAWVETVRYQRAFQAGGLSTDEHFSRLSKRMRKELKRKERRMEESGPTELLSLSPSSDLEAWAETFLRMEASGWKGRAQSALQTNPMDLAFFREILAQALPRGKLAMTLLQLNQQPTAGMVSFLSGDGAFAFKIAYDEQFAHFSPGALATLYSLQALLLNNRVRWIDSSAAPNHPLLDKLYLDRRTIVTLEIGLHGTLPLRLVHSARRLYRAIIRASNAPRAIVATAEGDDDG